MIANVPPSRRMLYVTTCVIVFILIGSWAMTRAWDLLCGNRHFSFYGRIVDETGRGIPGVSVDAQLLYSDGISLPVMFGRPERIQKLSVVTDGDGYYQFGPLTGYSISIRGLTKPGFKLVDAVPPPYPPSTWSSDDSRSWATLPNNQNRRDISVFKLVPRS